MTFAILLSFLISLLGISSTAALTGAPETGSGRPISSQPNASIDRPPAIPKAPTVTAPSLASLKATWKAPAPDVTGYEVQYREEPNGSWSVPVPQGPIAMSVIPKLKPATRYQVRVRAFNEQGPGQWSPGGTGLTKPENPRYDARTFQRKDGATVFLNRFIAGVKGEFSSRKAQDIAGRHGAVLHSEMEFVGMIILTTDFNTEEEHRRFLLELASDPDVRSAEPDMMVSVNRSG